MFLHSDDPELDPRVHSKVGQFTASILVPVGQDDMPARGHLWQRQVLCPAIRALLAPFGPLDVITMRKTHFVQSFCQRFMSLAGRLLLQGIGRFTSGGHQPNTCRLESGRLQLGQIAGSR